MKILVLGVGCGKCAALCRAAEQAVAAAGVGATVEKVADLARLIELAPRALPALVVDGRVVVAGRVPPPAEMLRLVTGG